MPPTQETEVDQLRDIMESLPDSAEHPGENRREYTLTKGDVLLIYRIAKVANTPHVCPFEKDDVETLQSAAQNISRTQKIASIVIVTALVGGMVSGIWFALKLLVLDFFKRPLV
jgi:tetrahydromethanopterin S-methyltransferase subunit F